MPHGNGSDCGDDSTDSESTRINRRRLLGSLGAAGAGFVAGCGGDGGTETEPQSTDGEGGGGTQTDDIVTFQYATDERPPTLDPHAFAPSNTNAMFAYPEHGYETLLFYNYPPEQEGEITLGPELATKVPTSENGLITNDGQTIEFPLKEGVMFHTGEEMTAEDVRFSWERAMTMGLNPTSSDLKSAIDSMEVVDDYTFRVTLTRQTTPIFLNSTVTSPGASIVSKAAVEEHGGVQEGQPNQWMGQNSAGTGPYMLGEGTPNSLYWAPHPEGYHGETAIDAVRQNIVGSPSSRIAQLQEGDLDGIYISVGDASEAEGRDGIDIMSEPQLNPGGIMFNYNIPYDRESVQQLTGGEDTVPSDFWQDLAVRRAFVFAVPWGEFIESVLSGYGDRTNCVHIPGMFGYNPDAPRWTQDLDRAEEELKNAGYWEEGFRITFHNENISEFTQLNLMIKDAMESLNSRISINSVKEPEGRAVERLSADPVNWPAEVLGTLPIGTDPTPYYMYFMHPDGDLAPRLRAPQHIDDRIVELISQTRTETNLEARREQFFELQQLCYERVPVGQGYAPSSVIPHRPCVEPAQISPWRQPHLSHWNKDNC